MKPPSGLPSRPHCNQDRRLWPRFTRRIGCNGKRIACTLDGKGRPVVEIVRDQAYLSMWRVGCRRNPRPQPASCRLLRDRGQEFRRWQRLRAEVRAAKLLFQAADECGI